MTSRSKDIVPHKMGYFNSKAAYVDFVSGFCYMAGLTRLRSGDRYLLLEGELDQLAGFVVGTPAEAEGFQHGGMMNEAGPDA